MIDPGTTTERSVTFPAAQVLRPESPTQTFVVFGPLHALRPGAHVVQTFVIMRADHWDGIGTDSLANLLPEGERLFNEVAFEVTNRYGSPGRG